MGVQCLLKLLGLTLTKRIIDEIFLPQLVMRFMNFWGPWLKCIYQFVHGETEGLYVTILSGYPSTRTLFYGIAEGFVFHKVDEFNWADQRTSRRLSVDRIHRVKSRR